MQRSESLLSAAFNPMLLLFESDLLLFRAPTKSRYDIACTAHTIEQLERITHMADETADINITCALNIWRDPPKWLQKQAFLEDDANFFDYPISSVSSCSSSLTSPGFSPTPQDDIMDDMVPLSPYPSTTKPHSPRKGSRFFVIKSYSLEDVDASMKNNIWASTELGNKRLDKAYNETDGDVYLFFSVNGSGRFCGVAVMRDGVDYLKMSDVWAEASRWKGVFPVEWLMDKEVPNRLFRHLKVPSNENKPVSNSRDTQEIPSDVALSMISIFVSH